MSFSSLQKKEIIEYIPKSSCCRRAFLMGVLASRATVKNSSIEVSMEKREYALCISALIKEAYGKDTDVFVPETGGRRILMSFFSPSALKALESFCSFEKTFSNKCKMCEGSFLKGIFIASGTVSDPKKQYSLEFRTAQRAELLFDYFSSLGLSPKISKKNENASVYFRRSSDIEDFFALAQMNSTAFEFMNVKITNDLRNNVNRIVNCETTNMSRSGKASDRYIKSIEKLIKLNLLSSLPEELEQTAVLRIRNSELSLSRLASLHTPPISKPGLSHRLKKIEEYAVKLTEKK